MDQSIITKTERIFETYEEIKKRVGDDRIALTVLQEACKDKRMDQMREEREQKNGDPATVKQINLIKKLKPEMFYSGLTKKEASNLIDELMGKSGE